MIEHVGEPAYVTPLPFLGEDPAFIDCPFCRKRTQTRVAHTDSTATTFVVRSPTTAQTPC